MSGVHNVAALLVLALPSASGYNAKDGLALAKLEQAVYCGEDRFNKWDVGSQPYIIDSKHVRFIKDNKTQAVAGVGSMTEPDGCFVAVQGTKGTVQSIVDADFVTKQFVRDSCPNCWVHSGWANSYESIKKELFATLEEFGCQDRPLYITGHSLGAAVLHYFLFDALDANFTVAHVTAMESPRPGDKTFASTLQAKMQSASVDAYRITHYQDIVVHLPPYGLANYKHALPEIYYKARVGTNYTDCGLDDESSNCANQWPLWDLTGDDHCWYADINPCGCSASDKDTDQIVFV